MSLRRMIFPFALTFAVGATGCNPYQNRDGEYYAGAVDPAKFPTVYLGTGGDPKMGGGVFVGSPAFVKGNPIFYYMFPLPARQSGAKDPLNLTKLVTHNAYVFDPQVAKANPYPAKPACSPPAGYQFDQQRDAYRQDEQGDIFTALPDKADYIPVVAEVPVTTSGETCQGIKSEATVLKGGGVTVPMGMPVMGAPTAMTDSFYLAWAIIDPGATVSLDQNGLNGTPPTLNANGLGPQKWGWYNHYLVAYLDGGYVPAMQMTVPAMNGKPAVTINEAVAQNLYYPDMVAPMPGAMAAPGMLGGGNDVLDAARGDKKYSPLCQVFTYHPADPNNPATDVAQIDQATIMPDPNNPYIYCLQVQ